MASLQVQRTTPLLLAVLLHVTGAVLPPGGPLHSFPGGAALAPPAAGAGPPGSVAFQPQTPSAPVRKAFPGGRGGGFPEAPDKVQLQPQPYAFQYAVNDAQTGADFRQQEDSDGSAIRGQYSVQLPDGRNQIVKYAATDATGFNAEVVYEGDPRFPPPTKTDAAPPSRPSLAFGGAPPPSPLPLPAVASPDFSAPNVVHDFGNSGKAAAAGTFGLPTFPGFSQSFPPLGGQGFGDFGNAGKPEAGGATGGRGSFGIRADLGGGSKDVQGFGRIPRPGLFGSNG